MGPVGQGPPRDRGLEGCDALPEQASEIRRLQVRLDPADAIAVGDGANDIEMVRGAGLGVALHAKQALWEAADVRLDHVDLTGLLYLQGYHRDEFVTVP